MIQKLSEVKGKLKVGDNVVVYDDSRKEYGKGTIERVSKNSLRVDGVVFNFKYGWNIEILNQKPSWDNLKKGDFIIYSDGDKRIVIEVLGDIVFLSDLNDFEEGEFWNTKQYLKKEGYKVVGAEEKTKLTKQQIADKFNIKVEDLEIEG